ncbi:YidH family protein [Streptomyces sp. CA-111067]|uniref:YidH family protein n=1 Tax=Streptomyces sp. CA-111067 TaxID=3240046 RepID=UPI003D99A3E5
MPDDVPPGNVPSSDVPPDDVPPGAPGRRKVDGGNLRTTLANERTLLAWSRTGLGLLAASFAVVKLTGITPSGLRLALGAYLVALATGVTAAGYVQWRNRQARIGGPEPLTSGLGALLVTVAMFLLAGFVVAVIVVAP